MKLEDQVPQKRHHLEEKSGDSTNRNYLEVLFVRFIS